MALPRRRRPAEGGLGQPAAKVVGEVPLRGVGTAEVVVTTHSGGEPGHVISVDVTIRSRPLSRRAGDG